ncbi:MAG: hypothetical protein E6J50_00040 [Chloroflexi bacterium]|nr:MAG: hypothetical protein E6J50_00040 [Chloroflexota bacterium]
MSEPHPTGRSSWRRIGAGACAAAVVAAMNVGAPARAAAPYVLRTDAVYSLALAAGAIRVAVSVTFTNTTADPAAGFSSFRSVPLSLQAGVSSVEARDRTGPLRVRLARQASRTVATVALRTALRYRRSAGFTLTYRLVDGADPHVRVRASSLMVPIWGFGTSSTVSVHLPAAYELRVMGGPLTTTTTTQRGEVVLSSGAIRDPSRWSALLVAARSTEYVTVSRTVALSGGTVDLRVRSFADDRAWGASTLDLVGEALPALQQAAGLPYVGVGPLVITESLPSGIGPLAEPASGAQEISVAFDATPFTVLHQLAHVWVGTGFASERWIREGLASHLAAIAARKLRIPVPNHAAADPQPRQAAPIALATWSPAGEPSAANPAIDAWAYAASWAFVDALAASLGEARLTLVLQRVARGVPAYDTAAADGIASTSAQLQPVDSRRFLDQVQEVGGGQPAQDAFRARVFPSSADAMLDLRARARAAYATLLAAAGDWGPPEPIRRAMEGWRFDEALIKIADAQRWLSDRDRLLDAARRAGLSTPDRLAMRWRSDGGDDVSRRELIAEAAFLQAYIGAGQRIDGPNPIESLGLLWGSEPRAVLAGAAGLYAGGDLDAAAAAIDRAISLDAGAQGAGVVRLAAGLAVVSVLAAGLLLALRRLRRMVPSLARS